MAFIPIPGTDINVGDPNKQSLWQITKDNFDDLDQRITENDTSLDFKTADQIFNLGIKYEADTPSTNDGRITIIQQDAISQLLPASPGKISFRSSTSASGAYNSISIESNLTLDIPSGATLGFEDGVEGRIYVYLLNNSGTAEIAVSNYFYDGGELKTTTTMSAGADSSAVLYSTTGRSNVPIKCIGYVRITPTTAGNWDNNASTTYGSSNNFDNNFDRTASSSKLGGVKMSDSCGTFNTSSGSYVDVTNLDIDLICSGERPVRVALIPDGTGVSRLQYVTLIGQLGIKLLMDSSTNIGEITYGGGDEYFFNADIDTIIFPNAGTRNFKCQIYVAQQINMYNYKLVAYEI